MAKRAICENAWMYHLNYDGTLSKYEGTVFESSNGHVHFVTTGNKHMGCPKECGRVVRDKVWLHNRNDYKAVMLIMKRKGEYIEKLYKKIDRQTELVVGLIGEV